MKLNYLISWLMFVGSIFSAGNLFGENLVTNGDISPFSPDGITEVKSITAEVDTFPATGRLFPVAFQNTPYPICDNIPGMLFLDIEGCRKTLLQEGLKMELVLPEELYLIGVSPYWPEKVKNINYSACVPEIYSAKDNNHYIVNINPNILKKVKKKGYSWRNFDRIFLGAKQGNVGKKASVKWRLIVGDKKGAEHSFAVIIIPPVNMGNIKCKSFGSIIIWPTSQNTPFPQVGTAYEKFWASLTEHPRACPFFMMRDSSPQIREHFLNTFKVSLFLGAIPSLKTLKNKEYINKLPVSISADGKPEKSGNISPYYVIEDPEGIVWDKIFPHEIKRLTGGYFEPEMIMFDYEPFVMECGFSFENRNRFAKHIKLEEIPSIQDVKAKYKTQWLGFRRHQNSLVVKRFCDAVHRHFPGIKAVLISNPLNSLQPQGPLLSSWCNLDVRLSDNDVDLFANMPYYTGLKFYETIETNNKLLKKKNFPIINPAEQIKSFYDRYNGPKIEQNIIAAAALGCTGLGFWPTDCLDADYLSSIKNAYFAVSIAEDCYLAERCDDNLKVKIINVFSQTVFDGARKCIINHPNFKKDLKLLMHSNNDEYVITALNYDSHNTAIIRASIPEFSSSEFQVADAVSRKSFPFMNKKNIRNGFLFSVAPGGVVVIKIGMINFTTEGTVSQAELEKTGQIIFAKFKNDNSFKSLKKGSANISWSIMPGEENYPALMLQSGNEKIYIDTMNGANIAAWVNSKTNNPLRYKKENGFLGDFLLYDTRQCCGPYKFELIKTEIKANNPEALFSYTVPSFDGANPEANPLEGLVVNKRISFAGSDGIHIDFTLTNRSPYKTAMNFGFRVRNLPYIGGSFSGLNAPVELTTISWGKDNKIKPIEHMLYLKADYKIDFLPQIKRQVWNGNSIFASAKNEALRESIEFEAKKAAGFFVWRSPTIYTVELLSKTIELSYGETYEWPLKINASSD